MGKPDILREGRKDLKKRGMFHVKHASFLLLKERKRAGLQEILDI